MSLPLNACADTAYERFYLVECCHGGVARCGHGESAVRRPVFDRAANVSAGNESVDESRREAVASADPIENLEARPLGRLRKALVSRPRNRGPIVHGCTLDATQGRCDHTRIGKNPRRPFDHCPESSRVELGEVLVNSFHLEPKAGREVFLVADYDIDLLDNSPVHRLCPVDTSGRSPKAGTVIEVVRDDRSMETSDGYGLENEVGCGVG